MESGVFAEDRAETAGPGNWNDSGTGWRVRRMMGAGSPWMDQGNQQEDACHEHMEECFCRRVGRVAAGVVGNADPGGGGIRDGESFCAGYPSARHGPRVGGGAGVRRACPRDHEKRAGHRRRFPAAPRRTARSLSNRGNFISQLLLILPGNFH